MSCAYPENPENRGFRELEKKHAKWVEIALWTKYLYWVASGKFNITTAVSLGSVDNSS
jgi:hypothetical protein